jgi:hypothetical protein
MGFTAGIFEAVGIKVEPFFQTWILPCGPMGDVLVASGLVEAKQSVIYAAWAVIVVIASRRCSGTSEEG